MGPSFAKRTFSLIGFGMVVLFLVPEALTALIGILLRLAAPQVLETGWAIWLIMYVPLYLVAFPLMLLIFRAIPNQEGGHFEKWKPSIGQMFLLVLVGSGVATVLSLVSSFLSELVSHLKGSAVSNPLESVLSSGGLWLNLFFVVLVAPIMEEIIFRGILYKKLIPYGGKTYIFFSALFFALFHKNIYQIFFAFALGLLYATVTYYTGSIRYSILLHMAQNLLGGGIGLLLQAFASEGALQVWGTLLTVTAVAGIVIGIVWLARRHRDIVFASPTAILPAKHTYLLSAGMIFFWVVAAFFLIVSLLV